MNILFLAAEASPLSKVGGLGDVAGELPRALRRLGVDVRTALPLHASTDASKLTVERTLRLSIPRAGATVPAAVHLAEQGDLPFWLVDSEAIRAASSIYAQPAEDGEKYTQFCRAAVTACECLGWIPDIVHANDWHTAPAVSWASHLRLASPDWAATRSVLTIHNLAYMGGGSEAALEAFLLPRPQAASLPAWARSLPLPLGLAAADGVTTVSPSYAAEIRTPEFGCGLDRVLAALGDRLQGILNGIDSQVWNPATDEALPRRYSAESLAGRDGNKQDLQRELGLPQDAHVPLLAMVTRMDSQKGVDLALEALPGMLDLAWQFVLLGTGEEALEVSSRQLAAQQPDRVRAVHRFDAGLARRIYAASDLMLVPSRYEPCGLTQMIAMRYGSIPVVRATGGLRDSVTPLTGNQGTGFVFESADSSSLESAVRAAIAVYRDPVAWQALQRRAMAQDFGWDRSARAYRDFYDRMTAVS